VNKRGETLKTEKEIEKTAGQRGRGRQNEERNTV
jgi:hypothetical protein